MARRLRVDEWLFAATVGLTLFGVVMVYSASVVVAAEEQSNPFHYLVRQALWAMLGLGAMLFAMRFDYERFKDRRLVYGLLAVVIALLFAVFAFPRVNGAHRWIRLFGFSVQPSELAKLALVLFLARHLERHAGEEHSLRAFIPCVLVTGALALLIVAEPDLGTALMLLATCLILCFVAGLRARYLCALLFPAMIGFAALLVLVPWRMRRLMAFLDPWADPQGAGYQVVQSLIGLGSGGVHGLGFAQGKQKMFFLPFSHSDFIFAVVGEELGLVGTLAVLMTFLLFGWRGVRAALNAPDRFGLLLGIGIVGQILTQALFNMSVVLSLVPTKGIPLPFVSSGGSSLVPLLFSVGMLLNISARCRAQQRKSPSEFSSADFGSLKTSARTPWRWQVKGS
ncbi:MAG: putative lipid II flippase FtsW [Pyrinomonas sp.]|uniref:putative lipid II flippase FtsW n=1 Tax=Pyrinomonas sp. TaxID=2080306 RepID=UPI00332BC48D